MTDGDRFQNLDEPFAEDRQTDGDESGEESGAPNVETPRAQAPTTEVPETPVPSTRATELEERAAEVDPTFKALFWKLVLLYKLGLIGLTIGVLLMAFDMYPTRGPLLTAGSVALLLYAVVVTYRGKLRVDAGEFDLDTGGDDRETEASAEEPSP